MFFRRAQDTFCMATYCKQPETRDPLFALPLVVMLLYLLYRYTYIVRTRPGKPGVVLGSSVLFWIIGGFVLEFITLFRNTFF